MQTQILLPETQHKFSEDSVPGQWRTKKQSGVVFNYQATFIPAPLPASSLNITQRQSYYHRSACSLVRFDSNQQGRDSVSPYLDGFDAIGSDIQYLQLAADTEFDSSTPKRSSLLLEATHVL